MRRLQVSHIIYKPPRWTAGRDGSTLSIQGWLSASVLAGPSEYTVLTMQSVPYLTLRRKRYIILACDGTSGTVTSDPGLGQR